MKRAVENIAPQSFNGRKGEQNLSNSSCHGLSSTIVAFWVSPQKIFHFLGDDSGAQTSWQRGLRVMEHSKEYLAWVNAAHAFLPVRTVLPNRVFANAAEPLSLQRTPSRHEAAPAPRQLSGCSPAKPRARPTPGRAG